MSDPLESLTDAELVRAATPSVTTGGGPIADAIGDTRLDNASLNSIKDGLNA